MLRSTLCLNPERGYGDRKIGRTDEEQEEQEAPESKQNDRFDTEELGDGPEWSELLRYSMVKEHEPVEGDGDGRVLDHDQPEVGRRDGEVVGVKFPNVVQHQLHAQLTILAPSSSSSSSASSSSSSSASSSSSSSNSERCPLLLPIPF